MDATMFQLRLFVHQRLYAAVEEILGQVEKTITLVLHEADVRAKEEADGLRHQLKSAEELPATSALQHGDECDSPLLQENQGPTNTEESDVTPSPENPGTPEPTADLSSNSGNYCLVERLEVKTEQEEHGEHEYESFFSPPEIVKSEEEQLDTQIHEMQMLSSNSPTAVSEEKERGEQAITVKRKEKMMQGKRISDGKKAQAASSNTNCSVKGKKGRRFCHLCGKCFHYTASLMKHIKTHEKCTSCIICGTKYRCPKELVFHLKKKHREAYFCDVCGKTFFNSRSLQTHERTHTETKEFVCQECGKTYRYKHCLISHVRIHSGEKPYPCDICGKRFSQNSNMNRHKTTHMGEKP